MSIFFAALLAALMLLFLAIDKTYKRLTFREAKRQAQRGQLWAKKLYQPLSYRESFDALLWILILVSGAGSVIILATTLPAWLALIFIIIEFGVGFWWIPQVESSSAVMRATVLLAPAFSKCLYYTHRLMRPLGKLASRSARPVSPGVYEAEDLVRLLDHQQQFSENRIPKDEIAMLQQALVFTTRRVSDVALSKHSVKLLNSSDAIGPVLIDDLHKSGRNWFLVYEGKRDHLIGTLYLRDLVHLNRGGTIADVMRPELYYVHESYTLFQVWQAFVLTSHHVFIVVNDSEEFVGIVTIEDALKQLLGEPTANSFQHYDDRHAVATSVHPPVEETDFIIDESIDAASIIESGN